MWVFLIVGGRVSRWKTSAEPETCKTTNEPRFLGLKARREVCPPTVPDNEPASRRPRVPPRQDDRANGSHPRGRRGADNRGQSYRRTIFCPLLSVFCRSSSPSQPAAV